MRSLWIFKTRGMYSICLFTLARSQKPKSLTLKAERNTTLPRVPWPLRAPDWAGPGPGQGCTSFPHKEVACGLWGPRSLVRRRPCVCHKQPGSPPPCSARHTRWTLAADLGPVPRPGAAGSGSPSCSVIRGAPRPLWPVLLSAPG